MLEIVEFTEARLTGVTNRTEKHGDEDVPAVTLACEITTANTLLDMIDPAIRLALYKAVEGQEQLPGVEPATPVLRCNCFESVALTTAHEGWRLQVDDGIDDTAPMEFEGVKVDKLKVDAKHGGSIVLKLRLGTSDIDADRLGKLGMHNGQSIWLKLLKPEKTPDAIDGSVAAFQADHPDAGDLFAASGTSGASDDAGDVPGDADAEGDDVGQVEQGDGAQADAVQRGENWPFPKGAADGSSDEERSARARAEQSEIEAGMAQSIAAAGVTPKGRRSRKAGVHAE